MQVDEAHWPIATLTFSPRPSEEEILAFVAANERFLATEERHATVVDMRAIIEAHPNQRRMTAAYVKRNFDALKKYRTGVAFVLNSSFLRGIVTAVMWLQRPPYEWTTVSTVEAGVTWCEQRMKA